MRFEWDEVKNRHNIAKHGISFERAITIFAGDVVSAADNRCNYGETRICTLGRMENIAIILVAHTDRNGVMRIISARTANRQERKRYEEKT